MALFSISTRLRAKTRYFATCIEREKSRRVSRRKALSSSDSARKALITLIPERISSRRCVTSAYFSWRRLALSRIRRPKIEITPIRSGPSTSDTSASCHEMKKRIGSPTQIITNCWISSPKTNDSAPWAPETSCMVRVSTSPRRRSWWKRSGSASSFAHTSRFMSIMMRPSTHSTR